MKCLCDCCEEPFSTSIARSGQEMVSYPCGCSYHSACSPGLNNGVCVWCKPHNPGAEIAYAHKQHFAVRAMESGLSRATSLFRGSAPAVLPILTEQKMLRKNWAAKDLMDREYYRARVITQAKIPFGSLTRYGLDLQTLYQLNVDYTDLVEVYFFDLPAQDLLCIPPFYAHYTFANFFKAAQKNFATRFPSAQSPSDITVQVISNLARNKGLTQESLLAMHPQFQDFETFGGFKTWCQFYTQLPHSLARLGGFKMDN